MAKSTNVKDEIMKIDIRDDIPPEVALEAVKQVVREGKISKGEHGKMYYCWATSFSTNIGKIMVVTRQYRKSDCFVVYKDKQNESTKCNN